MKFGRIYAMSAEGATLNPDGTRKVHYINFPLTCRFTINRNTNINCGAATFQIYNLAIATRNDLYQDWYQLNQYRQVQFAAGYQQLSVNNSPVQSPSLPVIYTGNIQQCYSYRQGPDWITEIRCLDGGYATTQGYVSLTAPVKYTFSTISRNVIGTMPQCGVGAIGALDTGRLPSRRGITFCGNPWDLITRVIKPPTGSAFIDHEKVYILNQWEYIQLTGGYITTVSAQTGMLDSPKLQESIVTVRMIFEPNVRVQQTVQLVTTENKMTGTYIVRNIDHGGTISGAVCEDLETRLTLYQPDRSLVGVSPIPSNNNAVAGVAA